MTSFDDNSRQPSATAQSVADGFLASFQIKIDPALLQRALTHRSWSAENNKAPHYERLEFLGDSILGYCVTTYLYKRYPKLTESQLTRRRAAVVSTTALAGVARQMQIGELLLLSKGERESGGRDKDSILADALEAIIGAAFLSTNIDQVKEFVLRILGPQLEIVDDLVALIDPKSALQELAGKHGCEPAHYEITSSGPDHNRVYQATVELLDVRKIGTGSSKKAAEIDAASQVLIELQRLGLARKSDS